MKPDEITKLLESLNPAIESITDSGVKTIIHALITIIHEQQKIITAQQKEIEELKEKLNINSNNSSTPPSGDRFKSGKKNKGKNKRNAGGQPGHKGVTRSLLPSDEVNHIEQHQPPEQCACGGQVQSTRCYQRHHINYFIK